mgnify:CR=1 FL=1|jgi:hypothetical protein
MEKNISRTFNSAWPDSAVDSLRRHWLEGLTTAEIASRLGKTARAVECKIYKLRVRGCILPARRRGKADGAGSFPGENRIDQRARRRCLYCAEQFDSSHPGNRICPGCLEDGPFTSAMV